MPQPFTSDTIQYTPIDDPQLDALARAAYVKVQSSTNNAYVAWDALSAYSPDAKTAWLQAAQAVIDQRVKQISLDEREKVQIAHASDYAINFQQAGAPGHGQFLLIAKLARVLGLR